MPNYQLEAILVRIGLALVAGLLAALVPIAVRKARFAVHPGIRIASLAAAILALVGFALFGRYLWLNHVPHDPDPPASPVAYPQPPAKP